MKASKLVGACALLGIASAAMGTGPHWPGLKGLQYMFVFGDSYSTVSWAPTQPAPSPENPIGVQWPGLTSVGMLQPNWVGYMTNGFNVSNLLALDYAISGNNVTGFTSQIQTEFMPTAGQKPATTPWTADNSVFVSWIGINDLGENADINATINQVMQQQQSLYAAGARNFILFNVPPWDRSPLGAQVTGLDTRVLTWNAQLAASALAFSNQNTDITMLGFSAWDSITSLLNNPAQYNISDATTIGGGAWKDDLHPTSVVHYKIATDLAAFLNSLPAGASTPASSSVAATTTPEAQSQSQTQTRSVLSLTTPGASSSATAVYNAPSSTPSASAGIESWKPDWVLAGLSMAVVQYLMG